MVEEPCCYVIWLNVVISFIPLIHTSPKHIFRDTYYTIFMYVWFGLVWIMNNLYV